MKKSVFFIILFLYVSHIFEAIAKDGIYLSRGAAWVDGFGYEQEGQYKLDGVKLCYYKIDGDSLINGKSYYRISRIKRCMTSYKLDVDGKGKEYVREKELIIDDEGVGFFMREDEAGDIWFYTEEKDVFEEISNNTLYKDFAEHLVRRDLFLFNIRHKYSIGDKLLLGVIEFDSPNGIIEEKNHWDIFPYEVKAVDEVSLLDGKTHKRYNKYFVEGLGPLNGPLIGFGSTNSFNADLNQLFAFYQNGQLIYRNEGYLTVLEELFPNILDSVTDDTPNAINEIPQQEETNAIYDLQGRWVNSKLMKGIYIQNGKKVAIK